MPTDNHITVNGLPLHTFESVERATESEALRQSEIRDRCVRKPIMTTRPLMPMRFRTTKKEFAEQRSKILAVYKTITKGNGLNYTEIIKRSNTKFSKNVVREICKQVGAKFWKEKKFQGRSLFGPCVPKDSVEYRSWSAKRRAMRDAPQPKVIHAMDPGVGAPRIATPYPLIPPSPLTEHYVGKVMAAMADANIAFWTEFKNKLGAK